MADFLALGSNEVPGFVPIVPLDLVVPVVDGRRAVRLGVGV